MRKLRKLKQAIMDKVAGPRWYTDWCTNHVPHAPGILCRSSGMGTATSRFKGNGMHKSGEPRV